jgi:hypothetical protein
MKWDIVLKRIRTRLGETKTGFFTDQDILGEAQLIQLEIASYVGGVTQDFFTNFPFTSYEWAMSPRVETIEQIYLLADAYEYPLAHLVERPIYSSTYPSGRPDSWYFLRKEGPDGPMVGMYPAGTDGTTGTGTVTCSGTAVTGVGTLFTTELGVGQYIKVSGQTRIVSAITSATALTVTAAFSPAISSAASFTYAARTLARCKCTPLEYGLRVTYSGAASAATVAVTSTAVVLTTTTAGVTTTTTALIASYPTYSAMATYLATVSGFTADTPHDDVDRIRDLEVAAAVSCKSAYIELYDGIKLDKQLIPLLVKGTTATMRRRDNDEGRARSELNDYYKELKERRSAYKAQQFSVPTSVRNCYPYPSRTKEYRPHSISGWD